MEKNCFIISSNSMSIISRASLLVELDLRMSQSDTSQAIAIEFQFPDRFFRVTLINSL